MRHGSLAGKARAAALALLLAGCTGAPERVGQAAGCTVGPVWVAEEITAARISVVAA